MAVPRDAQSNLRRLRLAYDSVFPHRAFRVLAATGVSGMQAPGLRIATVIGFIAVGAAAMAQNAPQQTAAPTPAPQEPAGTTPPPQPPARGRGTPAPTRDPQTPG